MKGAPRRGPIPCEAPTDFQVRIIEGLAIAHGKEVPPIAARGVIRL